MADMDIAGIIIICLVAALVAFGLAMILIKKLEKRPDRLRHMLSKGHIEDEASNAITSTIAIINNMSSRGMEVAEARSLMDRAQNALEAKQYAKAITWADQARAALARSKGRAGPAPSQRNQPHFSPAGNTKSNAQPLSQSQIHERLEIEAVEPQLEESQLEGRQAEETYLEPEITRPIILPEEKMNMSQKREQELPIDPNAHLELATEDDIIAQAQKDDMPAKFMISQARSKMHQARSGGYDVSEPQHLLEEAQVALDNQNFGHALHLAVQSKKRSEELMNAPMQDYISQEGPEDEVTHQVAIPEANTPDPAKVRCSKCGWFKEPYIEMKIDNQLESICEACYREEIGQPADEASSEKEDDASPQKNGEDTGDDQQNIDNQHVYDQQANLSSMIECSSCSEPMDPEEDAFCGKCGTPIPAERLCEECNAAVAQDDEFCRKCGNKL